MARTVFEGTSENAAETPQRSARAVSRTRLMSNWFFGVALGILAYYGVTDLLAERAQQVLRAESPALSALAISHEVTTTLDFSAWKNDAAYWAALREGEAFARLVCDAMGLDAVVVRGVAPRDLTRGPGWAPYTDVPGPTGNCGISGHRTTYGAPFRRIDRVKPGDAIVLVAPYTTYRYVVERVFVVRPDQVEVFDTTDTPSLTLTACHPPYSARYRIVVRAKMVGASVNDTTGE
ncbi:class E sortase [Coriobacteriia bacterium Es71-Z0120]|uniref:class E sortase n=1 Tax=Parvivirga hydrogeniphila TaxID=2939460 RepID=UPI002260CB5F|nr:class E sortase [Parvivirga hydrogeniphila]MCL4078370.1 class E sortase [Parvivirga hydrogeniphila]